MQCQKCGRVVRPTNCRGRDESLTERRYYCSCGFVNKTYESVVMTWKKTAYKPRAESVEDYSKRMMRVNATTLEIHPEQVAAPVAPVAPNPVPVAPAEPPRKRRRKA